MSDVMTRYQEAKYNLYRGGWATRRTPTKEKNYTISQKDGKVTIRIDIPGIIKDSISVIAKQSFIIFQAKTVHRKVEELIDLPTKIVPESLTTKHTSKSIIITGDQN